MLFWSLCDTQCTAIWSYRPSVWAAHLTQPMPKKQQSTFSVQCFCKSNIKSNAFMLCLTISWDAPHARIWMKIEYKQFDAVLLWLFFAFYQNRSQNPQRAKSSSGDGVMWMTIMKLVSCVLFSQFVLSYFGSLSQPSHAFPRLSEWGLLSSLFEASDTSDW